MLCEAGVGLLSAPGVTLTETSVARAGVWHCTAARPGQLHHQQQLAIAVSVLVDT